MKKTLLFVLLGAAAGVVGYQIYKKRAERAEDFYAQEASEHQFGTYITKPVKTEDAKLDTAGKQPIEEPEAVTDAEAPKHPEENSATEFEILPKTAEDGSADPVGEATDAEDPTDAVVDTVTGKEMGKRARKPESKKG